MSPYSIQQQRHHDDNGFPQPLHPQNLPGASEPPPAYDGDFPQPYRTSATTITTSSVFAPTQQPVNFGPDAQAFTCPNCHAQIISNVESKPSTRTHLFALALCCCLCWPCAWVPYCMESCQNRNHSCPNCGTHLGTHRN